MGKGIDFDMRGFPTDAEIERMFKAVPILERYAVQSKVVRAGAKPIVKRARQLAPRSTNAPAGPYRDRRSNRDKRSKKQRGEADWDYPLWKTIKQVVRKGKFASLAVIGPEWPKGNKEHFNTSPGGRRQVLWGTHTGKIVPQIRNWIVQAFDETRPQQLQAMKRKLKQLMDYNVWK
jgi:hypothetical protein